MRAENRSHLGHRRHLFLEFAPPGERPDGTWGKAAPALDRAVLGRETEPDGTSTFGVCLAQVTRGDC